MKQVGELLKSRVNGCLMQICFVGHRKGTHSSVKLQFTLKHWVYINNVIT